MYKLNFSLVNLGCTKNLVDSQYLIGKLLSYSRYNEKIVVNYSPNPYDKEVEFVFLNTCGFLSSGRIEMIQKIKKLLSKKKTVYILGCAAKYFLDPKLGLSKDADINEINVFNELIETGNVYNLSWADLENITIKQIIDGYNSSEASDFKYFGKSSERAFTNIEYGFEYLKIAEGCNNSCSFCIIPKIRGKQRSVGIDSLIGQTYDIIAAGGKEIIITSQDTTRYGVDINGELMLFDLLEKMESIDADFMFRLLYLYPDVVSLNNLKKLKSFEKFIPYFDIPLQHISSGVLKRMGRFYDTTYIYKFLDFIKDNFENHFIRTNFIVGFPGETEEEFNELCEFAKKGYFDNIAIFQYHDEPLASSSKLDGKISDEIINIRFNKLKKIIDKSLSDKSKLRNGKQHYGFIQDIFEVGGETKLLVRDYLHAPEIDSYDEISYDKVEGVYNENGELEIGTRILYNL